MRHAPLLLAVLALASARSFAEPVAQLTSESSEPLAVTGLSGEEAISALYRYDVELSAAPASFESLLGHEVDVSMPLPGGTSRHFVGIVNRVSQGAVVFHAQIVPKLWLLTRRARSRMFQAMSVPEILGQVFGEGQVPFSARLTGEYPRRDCVAQYNETDFAFVSRLMEDEGIFYYFVHDPGGETLVLGDSPVAHSDLPGGATLRWVGQRPGRGVHEWAKTQELRSGKRSLRDVTFWYPDDSFPVSALLQESVLAGGVTHRLRVAGSENLELYEYPGGYAQRFDDDAPPPRERIEAEGERTVAIRAEEEGALALHVEGASDLGQLASGYRFALSGDPRFDGAYVVSRVTHKFNVAPSAHGVNYTNTFSCIPAALPFRPQRVTPRPLVDGVQAAVVAGPSGSEIDTDAMGRIKVHFFWDREGTSDEHSSCWIRVGALHAGQENGFAPAPEVGDEVIIGFEYGDPDRPVVLGSLYNPKKPPPGPQH